MKLSFSRDEVLGIMLQYVRREFPRAEVNTAEVVGYSSFTEVEVSYEQVAEQVAETAAKTDTIIVEEFLA